jgi:hypothetical protein
MAGSLRETELEADNIELRVEIAAFRERIEELERRPSQDSRSSSRPPSSGPPSTRQQRRALARERAKRSLRERGEQPGHEGKHRQMAPSERVDHRSDQKQRPVDLGDRPTLATSATNPPRLKDLARLKVFEPAVDRRLRHPRLARNHRDTTPDQTNAPAPPPALIQLTRQCPITLANRILAANHTHPIPPAEPYPLAIVS